MLDLELGIFDQFHLVIIILPKSFLLNNLSILLLYLSQVIISHDKTAFFDDLDHSKSYNCCSLTV